MPPAPACVQQAEGSVDVYSGPAYDRHHVHPEVDAHADVGHASRRGYCLKVRVDAGQAKAA